MKCGDFIPILEREIDILGASLDSSIRDLLFALGTKGSHDADDACRRFSYSRKWPQLSARVKLEVCLRLVCASWYCRGQFEQDLEDETEADFLQSLLIEYWLDVGRTDWLYEAFVHKQETGREFKETRPPLLEGDN